MLEKIGLPPKPSVRGNNWVVDASHCQGCSSQFTFINRKHHCRRCGGLFCGSCTQGRMVLRGQGDSAVRVCEPCKNLEEAARFEMRYGHKNRAGKGGSKLANKDEDDLLHQILGGEHKQSSSSSKSASSSGDMLVNNAEVATTRSASSSSFNATVPDSNVTPEELREQALEEKKKHRTLKSEGKPEEALKAFKRGKELERQAGALEIHLRKIRKQAALSSSSSSHKDDNIPSNTKKTKDKDDIASELKDLGWSDMDLRESDKKQVKLSVESELYSLIGEKPRKGGGGGVDRSQVLAHKKKALELKREGNLAEAKEELKKAKILEKKIEEQELLGGDDDDDNEESDDELALLIRSMDEDKDKDVNLNLNFEVNPLFSIPDDIGLDDNVDVTEDDLEDPDLAAEMMSLGWEDDEDSIRKSDDSVRLSEIQSLKKEALSHKRAGNNTEALTLLKKAKMLEKDLNNNNTSSFQEPALMDYEPEPEPIRKPVSKSRFVIQRELLDLKKKALALRREGKSDESDEMLKKGKILEQQLQEMENTSKVTQTSKTTQTGSTSNNSMMIHDVVEDEEEEGEVNDQDLNDPTYLSLLKNLGWEEDDHIAPLPQERNVTRASINNPPKKSRGEVQRELLGLKRKYRALRQEGKIEEAEGTLKMAEVLETQLAEFDTPTPTLAPIPTPTPTPTFTPTPTPPVIDVSTVLPPARESEETVTVNEVMNSLEDDIMAHKRRALALKREGNIAEAKEELKLAKMLEKQMQENNTNTLSTKNESSPNAAQKSQSNQNTTTLSAKTESTPNVAQKSLPNDPEKQDSSPDSGPKPKTLSSRDRFKLQREALNHKREALKLRREGKTQEAEAESELAKALEAQIEESDKHDPKRAEPVDNDAAMVDDFLDPQLLSALKAIGITNNNTTTSSSSSSSKSSQNPEASKSMEKSNERKQFEEQIKAEKMKALNFKKAGKQAEALDALRRAKGLEKKMNSLTA